MGRATNCFCKDTEGKRDTEAYHGATKITEDTESFLNARKRISVNSEASVITVVSLRGSLNLWCVSHDNLLQNLTLE
jgi:hypothetical protein